MKISYFTLFTLFFFVVNLSAQKSKPTKSKTQAVESTTPKEEPKVAVVAVKSNSAFSEAVKSLNRELQTVENNKSQMGQTLSEFQPGVVKLNITSTTLKDGKSTSAFYEFNMADIDVNTIRTFTNKDVIQVQLLVSKKQKLIKKTTENQKSSYEEEVMIFAKNIDNGRVLVDLLKALVPLSNEIIEKRLSLKTYQEHVTWMENNITDVKLVDKQFVQKMAVNQNYPGRLELSIDEVAKQKTTNNAYIFNLANLNVNSIFSELKGDVIVVNIETKRKLKSVKTFSAKEQKDYVNVFSIYCESVEKSRDLQKVLKATITLSEDKIENAIPKIKSVSEGIGIIYNYIKNINVNETTYNQSFSGDCLVTFTTKESTPSKMTEEQLYFNLKDLGKNMVRFFTEGKNVRIELRAKAGNNFLKHTVNQELKSYTNKFEMTFAEIEDAMIAEQILESMIELCENSEIKLVGSKKDLLLQLKNNIKKVDANKNAFEQTFEIKEDNIVQFKNTEITEKASKTKIYEFNLNDINPSTVEMNTSSTNVFVNVNTNYMEKIIKYYEDGVIKNYQNSINIYTSNIEEARTIVELFKKIVQK